MNDPVPVIFIVILMFLVGIAGGYVYENESWRRDCKTLQVHRDGVNVYKCEPVKKETP